MSNATPAVNTPVSSALVLGIGGSGIQTLSRLRSAVRDTTRSGRAAVDNVVFLGMDAVEQTQQYPPLPNRTGLSPQEYLNIVPNGFAPGPFLRANRPLDPWLSTWWDASFEPPNMPLVAGLARSRMLGRLAFYQASETIRQRITNAMAEVNRLSRLTEGVAPPQTTVRVYIVTSSAGGTGSSGFLDVLRLVHEAGNANGVYPEVWPVVFLPGVFLEARQHSPDPSGLEQAHFANAYAFFRELDHMASVDGEFDKWFTRPGAEPLGKSAADLVRGVFLVDGALGNGARITQDDAFRMAASALYELLLTQAGRNQMDQSGVNVFTTKLGAVDRLDRRTAYASLGVARVIFPGSTFRRHARARIKSHLLEEYLIAGSANQVERAGQSGLGDKLSQELTRLLMNVERKATENDAARTLTRMASGLGGVLRDADTDREQLARDQVQRLRGRATATSDELRGVLREELRVARDQIDKTIDRALAEQGEPLTVLEYVISQVRTTFERHRDDALRQSTQDAQVRLGADEVQDESSLAAAEAAYLQQAQRGGLMGVIRGGVLDRKADALGDAAVTFARAVVGEVLQDARRDLAADIAARLVLAESALTEARRRLNDLQIDLDQSWREDEFEGKDAGPDSLTAAIPSDARPEVEDSKFARMLWNRVLDELRSSDVWGPGAVDGGPDSPSGYDGLRRLYRMIWRDDETSGSTRGLIGLGSGEQSDLAVRARRRFDEAFDSVVSDTVPFERFFPEDVVAAASMMSESGDSTSEVELNNAIANLLKLSDNVALQIDDGRFAVGSGGAPPPVVYAFSIDESVRNKVPGLPEGAEYSDSGDPEQIGVLTLRFGLPLHVVSQVRVWRPRYWNVVRSRQRRGTLGEPPAHTDRRFADALRPLLPPGYIPAEVALTVVECSVVNLVAGQTGTIGSLSLGGKLPVTQREERDGREQRLRYVGWTGALVDRDYVRWDRQLDLGESYEQLFEGIAANQGVGELAEDLFNRALREDEDEVVEQLTAYRENVESRIRTGESADQHLDLLLAAADELLRSLQRKPAGPTHLGL